MWSPRHLQYLFSSPVALSPSMYGVIDRYTRRLGFISDLFFVIGTWCRWALKDSERRYFVKPLWSSPHGPGIVFGAQSLSEKSRLMVGLESNETLTLCPSLDTSLVFLQGTNLTVISSLICVCVWGGGGGNSVSGDWDIKQTKQYTPKVQAESL